MSAPYQLPPNLDYETELLLSSRWPHQAPTQKESGLGLAYEALLGGTECVALSLDRKTVHRLEADSTPILPSSGASLNAWKQRSFPHTAVITALSADHHAQRYAVLYQERVRLADGTDEVRETIEVRSLLTGDLALPGEQARLHLTHPPDEDATTIYIFTLLGDFLLVARTSSHAEVRHWNASGDLTFPIIWEQNVMRAELHAPCFLSVQLDADESEDDDDEEVERPCSLLDVYRLQPVVALHVATFTFPGDPSKLSFFVDCGARIEQGENGLVVIVASGGTVRAFIHVRSKAMTHTTYNLSSQWLLRLSQLIDIVCPHVPSLSVEPRIFDVAWV